MRKAYSVIVTLIALGLLGYILAVPRATPDHKAAAQATEAPRSSGYLSQQFSSVSDITRSLPADPAPQKTSYVLNTNTKKFHKPSCSSVKQMKEKNKRTVTSTRQAIMEQGYAPCQRCKP